jgi:hypothetical protein
MLEAKMIAAPKGTFRESKRPHRFGGHVALMSSISVRFLGKIKQRYLFKIKLYSTCRSVL